MTFGECGLPWVDLRNQGIDACFVPPTKTGTDGTNPAVGCRICPTGLGQWTRPVFAAAERTSSKQQGRHAAAMPAVATITIATWL